LLIRSPSSAIWVFRARAICILLKLPLLTV
jgi:hypothetical protein